MGSKEVSSLDGLVTVSDGNFHVSILFTDSTPDTRVSP